MDYFKKQTFICGCHSNEHQISMLLDTDNDLFFTVHLAPLPFFRRIKNAIKYIFGHRSVYGDFEEFILKIEDVDKMIEILQEFKKDYDNTGIITN